ncbi:hypothetical protein ACFQJ5_16685 [Halomicroarcula sp. GCM10025324]|uniref:hypothetical protein n=1 Tax=Haloarcula TaxID=2237 RepID=UPI0023E7C9EC|nr:hypothetical protein [Halomicroarcula sp. ZS-22-S1]
MTLIKRAADGCIGLGMIVFGYTIALEFATDASAAGPEFALAAGIALVTTGLGGYFIGDALPRTDREADAETDSGEVSA